jgi:Sec-independent protein translocase protein TatA
MTVASPQRPFGPLAVRALTWSGLALIFTILVDWLTNLIPPNLTDAAWHVNFDNLLIERGIVPLVGVTFLLTAHGLVQQTGQSVRQGLQRFGVVLSAVLAVVFILVIPFYLSNLGSETSKAVKSIEQQAQQATQNVDQQLQMAVLQQQQQLQSLLSKPAEVEQAIQSGQLPQQQAEQFRKFQKDPKALDQFLQQQAEQKRKEVLVQINKRKQESIQQLQRRVQQTGISNTLAALLLVLGYGAIARAGLLSLRKPVA